MNVFKWENNLGSRINPDSRINTPIRPTFNIPMTQLEENIQLTRPTENISLTRPTEFSEGNEK